MAVTLAAGLLVVVALLLVLARAAGRLGWSRGVGDPDVAIKVLSRATLAPKQGLAVVQVGDRRMTVSFGEGGVRLLDGAEVAEVAAATRPSGPPVRQRFGVGSMGRSALLALALGAVAASGVSAQDVTPPPIPADVPALQVQPPGPAAGVSAEPEPLGPGVLWDLMRAAGVAGDDDGEGLLPGPVGAVLFIGFLTLLPTLLLLMTSFTRILVVLNLLRQAVGTQTAPPSHLLIALALLLTGFVMAPTLQEVNTVALRPWVDGEIDEVQMLEAGAGPFRTFMLSQVREQDLAMFAEMQAPRPASLDDVSLPVLTSAFVTSELRRAFQIGFALFLPFVVIDVVVASVLMSMGMFMLPPVMVSLPFKLLLFVMVDGWALMLGGLVRSFGV